MPNNLSAYCKLLVVSRIGGGKSRGKNYSHNAYASRVDDGCCISSKHLCLLGGALLCALLFFSSCHRGATVCGVPYAGATPWQLAAMIHANDCGIFVPVSVDEYSTKAYIRGYTLPDEQPAQIICDVEEGKVVWAVMESETNEKQ